MPTPTKGPRLGGSSAHQKHMLANLATAVESYGDDDFDGGDSDFAETEQL